MMYVLDFFLILRLQLRPTAKGRSLPWSNNRLKVKIAPTVQHWKNDNEKPSRHCDSMSGDWEIGTFHVFSGIFNIEKA